MRPVFAYIIALFLIVPFHTLSYVKTMLHLAQQVEPDGHEHNENATPSHDEDDHPHEHDPDQSSPESGEGKDLSHRHAPNQEVHSHEMDIWGLFSIPGVCTQVTIANLSDSVSLDPPRLDANSIISDPFLASILRPPIV